MCVKYAVNVCSTVPLRYTLTKKHAQYAYKYTRMCVYVCVYVRISIHVCAYIQYCAKVMQTNFDEIPGFSRLFEEVRLKRYFNEISPHFRDTYCFDPRDFSNDNSLCSMIHPEFSRDNSLLSKRRCDFSNNNLFLLKIQSLVYQ